MSAKIINNMSEKKHDSNWTNGLTFFTFSIFFMNAFTMLFYEHNLLSDSAFGLFTYECREIYILYFSAVSLLSVQT